MSFKNLVRRCLLQALNSFNLDLPDTPKAMELVQQAQRTKAEAEHFNFTVNE